MPIKKNVKIGRHENVTIIEFGTGDIAVSNGRSGEDEKVKVVSFGQHTPKPVEDYQKDIPNPTGDTDGIDDPVIFYFSRPESVDTVIRALEKVKQELIDQNS